MSGSREMTHGLGFEETRYFCGFFSRTPVREGLGESEPRYITSPNTILRILHYFIPLCTGHQRE